MGLLTEESDPFFRSSPASVLTFEDLSFIRHLPGKIDTIEKQKGPKGDDGYTPIKDKDYFDGKDGYTPKKGVDYFDGEDGVANMDEVREEMQSHMETHMKECDHSMIHDPKMLGGYELDVSTLQEGDILQVKGKKLVGVKPAQPDYRHIQNWVASQGVSNLRHDSVTASRELEPFILWIVDATAGDITLTIPSASGRENAWFEMIRIDPTSNTVTVQPTGSETFSGETSYLLQQFTDLQLFAYNGSYLIRQAT